MNPQARRLAWFAGAVVLASSAAIWGLGRQSVAVEPPDLISRGLASSILLAVPGVIGWIGVMSGRPAVVIAAGVLCLLQSVIAFSGVTLVYLVPGIAFLRAATAGPDEGTATTPIRPVRALIAVGVAIPIAILLVLGLGIFSILALVVAAGLAASRPRGNARWGRANGDAIRGAVIVALVIGGWAATLALTETTCWLGKSAPGGGIAWQRIPPTDTLTVGPTEIVSTCGDGTITPAGVTWAGGLVAIAFAVAAWRPPRSSAADQRG